MLFARFARHCMSSTSRLHGGGREVYFFACPNHADAALDRRQSSALNVYSGRTVERSIFTCCKCFYLYEWRDSGTLHLRLCGPAKRYGALCHSIPTCRYQIHGNVTGAKAFLCGSVRQYHIVSLSMRVGESCVWGTGRRKKCYMQVIQWQELPKIQWCDPCAFLS